MKWKKTNLKIKIHIFLFINQEAKNNADPNFRLVLIKNTRIYMNYKNRKTNFDKQKKRGN